MTGQRPGKTDRPNQINALPGRNVERACFRGHYFTTVRQRDRLTRTSPPKPPQRTAAMMRRIASMRPTIIATPMLHLLGIKVSQSIFPWEMLQFPCQSHQDSVDLASSIHAVDCTRTERHCTFVLQSSFLATVNRTCNLSRFLGVIVDVAACSGLSFLGTCARLVLWR